MYVEERTPKELDRGRLGGLAADERGPAERYLRRSQRNLAEGEEEKERELHLGVAYRPTTPTTLWPPAHGSLLRASLPFRWKVRTHLHPSIHLNIVPRPLTLSIILIQALLHMLSTSRAETGCSQSLRRRTREPPSYPWPEPGQHIDHTRRRHQVLLFLHRRPATLYVFFPRLGSLEPCHGLQGLHSDPRTTPGSVLPVSITKY